MSVPLPTKPDRSSNGGRQPCVLIVDDDDDFSSLLAESLRDDGCCVVTARSGRELVEYVRASQSSPAVVHPADLIVSDVRMPDGSGLVALEALAEDERQTPVLLMTAFGSDATHATARELGAAGVLDKPFDLDDFRMIVLNLVGHGKAV
jgi:two-component system nitrogen regulation response regulator GlnG